MILRKNEKQRPCNLVKMFQIKSQNIRFTSWYQTSRTNQDHETLALININSKNQEPKIRSSTRPLHNVWGLLRSWRRSWPPSGRKWGRGCWPPTHSVFRSVPEHQIISLHLYSIQYVLYKILIKRLRSSILLQRRNEITCGTSVQHDDEW